MTDVLQVSKFYHPDPGAGGLEQVVRTLAEGLDDRGYRSRVLASRSRGRRTDDEVGGVPVERAGSVGVAMSVPLSPLFPLRLERAAAAADVVHYHLPNPLAVTSDLLSGPTDAPTVVTYHSDIVRQSTALRLYRPVLHRFLDAVDHVFVSSPRLLEHSDHLERYREKTSVVPLSVDPDTFGRYDGPEFDSPVDDDTPLVLFVGRLEYYKGVEYLVDAMRTVDAHLLVVGDGQRREALKRRAADRGVSDRITFLGRVPEDRLHWCYDRADVFALPSVEPSEAFGVVQLEAMAYRTPVVNTDLPTGVPWVSPHGETGVTVPPRDPEALAASITELLDDDECRRRLGANGRRRVEERFSEDRMLDTIDRQYEALLDDRSVTADRRGVEFPEN